MVRNSVHLHKKLFDKLQTAIVIHRLQRLPFTFFNIHLDDVNYFLHKNTITPSVSLIYYGTGTEERTNKSA